MAGTSARYLKMRTWHKNCMSTVHYLDRPEVKEHLKLTKRLHLHTAQHWMHVMEYQYGKPTHGMYVDGHERDDVVQYRMQVFLPLWTSMEGCMMKWTNDNELLYPQITQFPQQK